MRKLKVILLFLPFLLNQINAQTDFNILYKAIEVPSNKILSINIDGKLNEWNWIPESYKYKLEDCVIGNESSKKTDFEGYFSFAWSKETNWFYFIASIKDDIINVDTIRSHYFNDKIELAYYLGDCSKSNINNPYYTPDNLVWFNLFCNTSEPKSGCFVLFGPDLKIKNNAWVIKDKRYAKFNCSINRTKDGKFIINYEVGMCLWENISKNGPEYSDEFLLGANKKIRAFLSVVDYDRFLTTELKHTYLYFYGGTWCSMPQINLDPFISKDRDKNNLEILLNNKIESL